MAILHNKPVSQITPDDIQELIDGQIPEDQVIDYKEALYDRNDAGSRELKFDVSAFANAAGGHLIIGVREMQGVPTEVVSVGAGNMDEELRRMEQVLNSGISPRIPGIAYKVVQFSNGDNVIVIRIPRSWTGPHSVPMNESYRFYSRGVNGKFPLNIDQIRSQFVGVEAISDRIRDFRSDRLGQIVADQTPVQLSKVPRLVLHLLPVQSFRDRLEFALDKIDPYATMRPINDNSGGSWHNFDGMVMPSSSGNSSEGYVQLYRDGRLESVDTYLLETTDGNTIPERFFAGRLIAALTRYKNLLREIGVEPPILAMVSLMNVRNYRMYVNTGQRGTGRSIDRDHLVIEDVLIESFDAESKDILRPIFDAIWRATGYSKCILDLDSLTT